MSRTIFVVYHTMVELEMSLFITTRPEPRFHENLVGFVFIISPGLRFMKKHFTTFFQQPLELLITIRIILPPINLLFKWTSRWIWSYHLIKQQAELVYTESIQHFQFQMPFLTNILFYKHKGSKKWKDMKELSVQLVNFRH